MKPHKVEQFYEGNEVNRTIYRDNTLMQQVNPIKLLERETEREREVPISALFLILFAVEPGRVKSNSFMKGMKQIERFIEAVFKAK